MPRTERADETRVTLFGPASMPLWVGGVDSALGIDRFSLANHGSTLWEGHVQDAAALHSDLQGAAAPAPGRLDGPALRAAQFVERPARVDGGPHHVRQGTQVVDDSRG